MRLRLLAAVLLLLLVGVAPGRAQYPDQITFMFTSGGTANAQTTLLANISTISDVQGVLLKFVPGNSNTGSATLAVGGTAATIIRKPGASGLVALTGGELQVGQAVVVMYDGTEYVLLSGNALTLAGSVSAASLANSALSFNLPTNFQLNATVGSNNLTVAVKGNNGSDPSSTNPVIVPFRDVTIASGDPVFLSITAALSFTVNSGNTMGCLSATMCRLWVYLFNNGGSPALCLYNALSFDGTAGHAASVSAPAEFALNSSQAGTSGGSSTQLIYCNVSSVTARSFRIVGYIEIQETVAGTWATGPTYVQLFGPGIPKPGETIRVLQAAVGSTSQAITPTSAANPVRFSASATASNGGSGFGTTAFLRGATTLLTRQTGDNGSGSATVNATTGVVFLDVPATTSSVTYSLSSGLSATILLEEIMGALEPVNDDAPLEAVG